MPRPYPDLEQMILALLAAGPMLQKDIMMALPGNRYMDVGPTIRDMDRRGLIVREKCGTTKMVTLVRE